MPVPVVQQTAEEAQVQGRANDNTFWGSGQNYPSEGRAFMCFRMTTERSGSFLTPNNLKASFYMPWGSSCRMRWSLRSLCSFRWLLRVFQDWTGMYPTGLRRGTFQPLGLLMTEQLQSPFAPCLIIGNAYFCHVSLGLIIRTESQNLAMFFNLAWNIYCNVCKYIIFGARKHKVSSNISVRSLRTEPM